MPGTYIDALLHADRSWSAALLSGAPLDHGALASALTSALAPCPPRLARRLRARYEAPPPDLAPALLRAHLAGREQAWARALSDLRAALAPPAAVHQALALPHPEGLLEALRASGVGLRGLGEGGEGGEEGAWGLSEERALALLEEAGLGVDESYEEALRRGRPIDLSGDARPAGEEGRGLERLAWALLCCPWPLLGAYAAARDPSGHAASVFDALTARRAPPPLSASPAPLPRDLFEGADLSVRREAVEGPEGARQRARGWLQVGLAGERARGEQKGAAARALGCFWALTPHALAARCPPDHPVWRGASHTPTTREGRAYALRQLLISAAARPARHPLGAAGQVPLALAWEVLCAVGERVGRPSPRAPRAPSRGRTG